MILGLPMMSHKPKPQRLTMDKVSERLESECELLRMLNEDLLQIIMIQVERTAEQQNINTRLKKLLDKYNQLDSNFLDYSTIAKLYQFMAEADGVKIVPVTYPLDNQDDEQSGNPGSQT